LLKENYQVTIIRNGLRILAVTLALVTLLFASAVSGLAHEGEDHGATPAASPGVGSASADLSHPAHIHRGTCDRLDPEPLHELARVLFPPVPSGAPDVDGAIPVMTSTTTLDLTLSDLLADEHAVDVHVDGEEAGAVLACGKIGGTPSGRDLSIGLQEQNGSAHAGIAQLHDNGDGTTTVTIFLAHGLAVPDEHGSTVTSSSCDLT
jgi:hypothetical protein